MSTFNDNGDNGDNGDETKKNDNIVNINETVRRMLVMPAEWEEHSACLILFPHNPSVLCLEHAQRQVLDVARAIATKGQETVWLLAKDEVQVEDIQQTLLLSKNKDDVDIRVAICPSDDTWIRDTGPTCCWDRDNRGKVVGVDWGFNAYGGLNGGCYWPCEVDRGIAKRCCDLLQIEHHDATNLLILEGGSIHTDGEGTLLVTKECLLNPNRNPHLSQLEIEVILQEMLGVTTILWLPKGLDADEDTNGHIDNFCCFVKPGHVVLAWTDDEQNDPENYAICREAETILSSSQDAKGRTLQVHKLQLPPPQYYTQEDVKSLKVPENPAFGRQVGMKMAASYINFYIANKAIIVPQFFDKDNDEVVDNTNAKAIETLAALFPDRTVVGVQSREILIGGGNIHCNTQQIPIIEEEKES